MIIPLCRNTASFDIPSEKDIDKAFGAAVRLRQDLYNKLLRLPEAVSCPSQYDGYTPVSAVMRLIAYLLLRYIRLIFFSLHHIPAILYRMALFLPESKNALKKQKRPEQFPAPGCIKMKKMKKYYLL